jgi:hypothetical protein
VRSFGAVRAGFVTMAGGVVTILGTLLPFQRISTTIPDVPAESFSALDLSGGPLYLGLGEAMAAFGLVILLGRGALPRALGALAALAGGIALVAGIVDVVGMGEEGVRILADAVAGRTPGVSSDQVLRFLTQRDVSVTAGIGPFVILAGSLLAVVGGVWAAVTRTTVAMLPPPSAPSTDVGEPPEEAPGD